MIEIESLRREVNELRERLAIAERQLAALRQLAPTQTPLPMPLPLHPLQPTIAWPPRPLYTVTCDGVLS